MNKFIRTLSAILAIVFVMAMPLTALAAESTLDSTGDQTGFWTTFPWARVITLVVIVVLIVVAIILSKTNTKLGLRINKFFKEYLSEIKKVSWFSFKDTMKATGIVLVILVVAAVAIGLLDFGLTHLIQLVADLV